MLSLARTTSSLSARVAQDPRGKCGTNMIGLSNPNQRSVAKTSEFPHPQYLHVARAGSPRGEILGARG